MLDSPALIELMNIMKKGQYLDLQYVPSLSHHPLFLENHLPQAVKFEQELLERVENKEHSIYEFCLSPKYYANRLGLTAETMLLAKLCLYEQPVERSEVESLLPQCLGVLDELCELTDDGKLHFPLRIVPIAQLLVVADRHRRPVLGIVGWA